MIKLLQQFGVDLLQRITPSEMADFQQQKSLVLSFYSDLEKATSETIDKVLAKNLVPDFFWYGVHPFGEQEGTESVAQAFWRPLLKSWIRVQRR